MLLSRRFTVSAFIWLLSIEFAFAQNTYQIEQATSAISVDGVISEQAWQTSTKTSTPWITTQPEFLKPSAYKSEIRMCYNSNGIYILAELFQPRNTILSQLCERDRIGNSNADNFSVFFDTYNDKQNGFAFKVTAANVQQDEKLLNGGSAGGFGMAGNGDADVGWDAVWQSATKIYDDKWVVELFIPFSCIRMPSSSVQQWGVNFRRSVRSKNETSFWNEFNPNQAGFLLQAGSLIGLKDIKPPLRLALFPYVNVGLQNIPNANGNTTTPLISGGMDLKYGINDAFTLDMSLIPDFSQVISDNLIRNLSPFEQQLAENRPFFTEGVELFNKIEDQFYSRRIGSRPDGYYTIEDEFADTTKYKIKLNPNVSRLYNTFKISGRTKNNIGIGIFNALQAPAIAQIKELATGKDTQVQTSPLTNYNMVVFDKAFAHQSYITLTNASTWRANNYGSANVTSAETEILNKKETHSVFAAASLSAIMPYGSAAKLGAWSYCGFNKLAGKYKYTIKGEYFGKQYDRTDMGIQFDYNHLQFTWGNQYTENKPKSKHLNIWRFFFNHDLYFNVEPFINKGYEFEAGYFILLKNFVDFTFYTGGEPFGSRDFYQIERFNRYINMPGYTYFGISGSSDSRRKFFSYWDASYGNAWSRKGFTYTEISNGYRYRVNNHFEFGTGFKAVWDRSNLGRTNYYYSINQPIIAFRYVHSYTWDINAQYNFNANSSLNGRFRHYNSFINTRQLYLVDEQGNWEANPIAMLPNLNENFNLQNIDIFYNWIFRPGSRFILSYKQWLNDSYILNDQFTNQKFINNVAETVQAPKAFLIAARMIWYVDYNTVRSNYRAKQKT